MKPTVESTPRIVVRQFREHPAWEEICAAGAVELTIGKGESARKVEIELSADEMPRRGGVRWWFRCPRCSALRRHLYLLDGELLCRGPGCHHLYYFAQTRPDSAIRRDLELPILKAWNRCRRAASTMDPQQATLL